MIETEECDDGTFVQFGDGLGSCLLRKENEPTIQIWSVRISIDQRNQGHGQRMIAEVLDYCKEQDKEAVWLQVYTDNDLALHMYQKLGFEITKTQPYNGQHVHHMELQL